MSRFTGREVPGASYEEGGQDTAPFIPLAALTVTVTVVLTEDDSVRSEVAVLDGNILLAVDALPRSESQPDSTAERCTF